jgi:hypothetical protein
VHLVSITLARDRGFSSTFPHFGALTSTRTTPTLQPPLEHAYRISQHDLSGGWPSGLSPTAETAGRAGLTWQHTIMVVVDHEHCGAAEDIFLLDPANLPTALQDIRTSGREDGLTIKTSTLTGSEFRWYAEQALDARIVHDDADREDRHDGGSHPTQLFDDDGQGPGYAAPAVLRQFTQLVGAAGGPSELGLDLPASGRVAPAASAELVCNSLADSCDGLSSGYHADPASAPLTPPSIVCDIALPAIPGQSGPRILVVTGRDAADKEYLGQVLVLRRHGHVVVHEPAFWEGIRYTQLVGGRAWSAGSDDTSQRATHDIAVRAACTDPAAFVAAVTATTSGPTRPPS